MGQPGQEYGSTDRHGQENLENSRDEIVSNNGGLSAVCKASLRAQGHDVENGSHTGA